MSETENERQSDLQERRRPKPPFPAQDQPKPGDESALRPKPRYEAPEYLPAGKLVGRNALVTGGDSGIGRAVAYLYAREGANVAIVYTPFEQRDAEITVEAVRRERRRALLLPGDVSDPDFCHSAVERTVDSLGSIDVLVNNAAFQRHQPDLRAISDEQWDQTFRTNIYGYFYMVRAALPHLRRGSAIIRARRTVFHEQRRSAVNVSSPPPEDAAGRVGEQPLDDLRDRHTSHKAGSRSIAQKEAGARYPDRSMPASRKVSGAFGREPRTGQTVKTSPRRGRRR